MLTRERLHEIRCIRERYEAARDAALETGCGGDCAMAIGCQAVGIDALFAIADLLAEVDAWRDASSQMCAAEAVR